MNYGLERMNQPQAPIGMSAPQTVTQRLAERKKCLEFELQQVNEVLATFEAQPQVQQVLDALAKINFGL